MTRKSLPTGREVSFKVREMFYSETDKKGVIRSSNEVFERVSGYPTGELIGKPHNIIRHPDMPRSLFFLLWQSILAGQPIAAFVKNLAESGDHYWVLAVIFPSGDEFVSIRIKATTDYLSRIAKIYAETLRIEKEQGLERGVDFLLAQIKDLGFSDYRLFTVAALNAELTSRSQSKEESGEANPDPETSNSEIGAIRNASQKMSRRYEDVTNQIAPMLENQKNIETSAQAIMTAYHEIKYVAVNMMADVEHLGDEARTLAVIATTFKNCSDEIVTALDKLNQAIDYIKDKVGSTSFVIASARMQVEMLAFFSTEVINRMERDKSYDPSSGLDLFARLCRNALNTSKDHIGEMERTLNRVTPWLASLADAAATLYFVRQNGKMEVARINRGDGMFGPQLEAMNTFIVVAQREGKAITQSIRELNKSIFTLRSAFTSMEHDMPQTETSYKASP